MISFYIPNVSIEDFPTTDSIRIPFEKYGTVARVDFGKTYNEYGDVFVHYKSINSFGIQIQDTCYNRNLPIEILVDGTKMKVLRYKKKDSRNTNTNDFSTQDNCTYDNNIIDHIVRFEIKKRDVEWSYRMISFYLYVRDLYDNWESINDETIGSIESWFLK